MDEHQTVAALSARLGRLERQNRALLVIAAALGALAAMGSGSEPQVPKKIEAESFVLRDPAGRVRAALTTLDNGSTAVVFFDKKQHLRLICGVNSTNVPSIQFNDAADTGRAVLGLDDSDAPGLDLSDRAGHRRVRLNVADVKGEQPAALNFSDARGAARVSLLYSDKISGLYLSDRQEKTRSVYGAVEDGTPVAFMQTATEESIWSAP